MSRLKWMTEILFSQTVSYIPISVRQSRRNPLERSAVTVRLSVKPAIRGEYGCDLDDIIIWNITWSREELMIVARFSRFKINKNS